MTSASQTVSQSEAIAAARAQLAPKIAGVAFASLFTALIWVAILSLAGRVLGLAVEPSALAVVGCAIAVFLAAVCSPIMLRDAF